MTLKNTKTQYGSVSKLLHWLIFLLVLGMLTVGFFMEGIADKGVRSQVYMMHKSTGLTILALMLVRLIWMLLNPKPQLPTHTPRWEKTIEVVVHSLFYVLLIAMPLSGWLMSTAAGHPPSYFGLFTAPLPGITKNEFLKHLGGNMHAIIAFSLIGLLSLHILAALKHHYFDRDNVLRRMMPGSKDA